MAKTISIALADHYAQGSTTLAWCWKATRRDGFILAVTTCARDFLFEGVLYQPRYGFNPKAIASEATGAVQNTEIDGFLSSVITEEDIEAGVWDGCEVETFQVNYRDFSQGKLSFGVKTMGDLKAGALAFNSELRGLTQSLQKIVGRYYTKGCPWQFGSVGTTYVAACNKALGPLTVTGSITSVTDRRTFADSTRAEADDYFGAGVITMTSGDAEGQSLEVYSFDSGAFVTHLPFEHNLAIGDTYSLTPGCRKRFTEDCVGKWGNGNNFGGFNDVPGGDKVLGLGGGE
jgi:uncharacterized phage protein (TIGR02218 family)